MSVNLFNRPELGLGPGSIEILNLLHKYEKPDKLTQQNLVDLFLNPLLEIL